jgi:hypothetical protein
MTWRTDATTVIQEEFAADYDSLAAAALQPGERVVVAAWAEVFLKDGAEWGGVPLLVTDRRFVVGKEKLFSGKLKIRDVALGEIHRFGGGPMRGVGPVWECIATGFHDVRIIFVNLLQGEQFTRRVERLLAEST